MPKMSIIIGDRKQVLIKVFLRNSITCSKIEHIPHNSIFTTKFNASSVLIMIISWDYLNLSLANEYVDYVTIPT